MIDVTRYMGFAWHPVHFNCWHLVREVYKGELGIDLPLVPVNAESTIDVVRAFHHYQKSPAFQALSGPAHLAIAAMKRLTTTQNFVSHVGVFIDLPGDPRILHNDNVTQHIICLPLRDLAGCGLQVIGYYSYA